MAHMTDKKEILLNLRERLDHNPIGLPEDLNVYEILSILFTDEEARLASSFPLHPTTLEQLETITQTPGAYLKKLLESMLKKGLVLESKKKGKSSYILSMALVGFFEFIFMRTNQALPMKKLAELIHEYRLGTKFTEELFNPATPRARALAYEKILPKTEILTFEFATELVQEAGRGALTKCYCRHETYHLDQACGYPIDDICISLGNASDFLVERGFARRASITEIMEKLGLSKELGLMHTCDNVKHNVAFICNCCGCCCCFLAGITKHRLPYAVATTNYIATINNDSCNECAECIGRCQIGAISFLEGHTKPAVDANYCLGCGACSSFCNQKAILMEKRKKQIIPPSNMSELFKRLRHDRGKVNKLD
ncbi:MAG: (Fe-S)-binding protein [Firmicutes bacterium]|nr:(Fe-S)-binding protein [Bacillota bacterium]